jgi:predicted amidohydrolase YtcJ
VSSADADLVLAGGRIRTQAHPSGFVQALAVRDGDIRALGRDDEIRELVGRRTRVIDLRGRLALPAFGDVHVHAVAGGLESRRCNLLGLRTRADCLAAVAAYAAGLDGGAWVLGGGWTMAAFPGGLPTAADLDRVTGGRPAFLPNRDHHSAWVNTAALRTAGIDATTPDPPDGRAPAGPAGTGGRQRGVPGHDGQADAGRGVRDVHRGHVVSLPERSRPPHRPRRPVVHRTRDAGRGHTAAGAGFQLHFHAIGDRAVSTALDALAARPSAQRRAARHHLAHLQFITPQDAGRFRALDAVANFQPLWATADPQMEELTIPFVGAERAAWQYRIGELARLGTRIAFGSTSVVVTVAGGKVVFGSDSA